LARLNERKIDRHIIEQAYYSPDRTYQKDKHTTEFQKHIDGRTFAVIVKQNDKGEKLIVSCWVNPPFPGTRDAKKRSRYLQMQHGSFWKKVWLTVLDQLGL
jgi:hypothetical protein